MNIRKISIGPDYKSGAMHYLVGQDILGGSHKEFNTMMPISIEYNINF